MATATGDLDADGKLSHYTLRGTLEGNKIEIAPMEITDELE